MASNNQTLACTYAALMLSDAGMPTTAENMNAAIAAAGVEVRATLPILFARFLEKRSIESLMSAASSVAPNAGAAPAAAAATGGAAAAVPVAEAGKAKKDEPAEEEDDDMGFGLFD